MLDKNDLQMIQEMMLASEQRLFGKIEESEQRMTPERLKNPKTA